MLDVELAVEQLERCRRRIREVPALLEHFRSRETRAGVDARGWEVLDENDFAAVARELLKRVDRWLLGLEVPGVEVGGHDDVGTDLGKNARVEIVPQRLAVVRVDAVVGSPRNDGRRERGTRRVEVALPGTEGELADISLEDIDREAARWSLSRDVARVAAVETAEHLLAAVSGLSNGTDSVGVMIAARTASFLATA